MSVGLAVREHTHYQDDGWRRGSSGDAPAGHRRPGVTKGLSAIYYELVSSRRECRQVVWVFLASLGIGFILSGVAAWAVSTGFSAGPIRTAEKTTGIVLSNSHSLKPSVPDDGLSVRTQAVEHQNFDNKLVAVTSGPSAKEADPPTALRAAEQMADVPSMQPNQPLAPQTTSIPVPDGPGRTAVYDIAGHFVYLPNGRALEAHSGFGRQLDDPRSVRVKNRGPTPPNVYQLKLREKLFHKVQAIRLIPVGDANMFGRDGMLAHPYMRGGSGESNGCISFKDYPAFLRAYLRGEIDRLVVVNDISNLSWRTANAAVGSQLLDTN